MSEQQAPDLVIILIAGPENPKRLPSAFFLSSTAAANEQSVLMYFTGPATELLAKGKAETIFPMPGGKSLAGFMKLAEDNGVQFVGCLQSLELNGMSKEDLAWDIPLVTPSAAMPILGAAGRILTW
ncbi:DsrE family protein [Acidithiobacillus sp. IBUN Pt1247-S3]|uniref:DsrE family protein n=1 Tax=Acidithiobacillus sp. IBUN Pt1247-S3 TaxID=3166642 RepID=UPI0034E4325D